MSSAYFVTILSQFYFGVGCFLWSFGFSFGALLKLYCFRAGVLKMSNIVVPNMSKVSWLLIWLNTCFFSRANVCESKIEVRELGRGFMERREQRYCPQSIADHQNLRKFYVLVLHECQKLKYNCSHRPLLCNYRSSCIHSSNFKSYLSNRFVILHIVCDIHFNTQFAVLFSAVRLSGHTIQMLCAMLSNSSLNTPTIRSKPCEQVLYS